MALIFQQKGLDVTQGDYTITPQGTYVVDGDWVDFETGGHLDADLTLEEYRGSSGVGPFSFVVKFRLPDGLPSTTRVIIKAKNTNGSTPFSFELLSTGAIVAVIGPSVNFISSWSGGLTPTNVLDLTGGLNTLIFIHNDNSPTKIYLNKIQSNSTINYSELTANPTTLLLQMGDDELGIGLTEVYDSVLDLTEVETISDIPPKIATLSPAYNDYHSNGLRIRTRLTETLGNSLSYEFEFENTSNEIIPAGAVRFYFYLNSHDGSFSFDAHGEPTLRFAQSTVIDYVQSLDSVVGGSEYEYMPMIMGDEAPYFHKKFTKCVVYVNVNPIPANATMWRERHKIHYNNLSNFAPERPIPNYSTYGYKQTEAHKNEKNSAGLVARILEYRHSYSYANLITSFNRLDSHHGIVFEVMYDGKWRYWQDDENVIYKSPTHPLHTATTPIESRDSDGLPRVPTYKHIGSLRIIEGGDVESGDTFINITGPDIDNRGIDDLILSASTTESQKNILLKFDESELSSISDEIEYAELWLYAESFTTEDTDWDSGEAITAVPLSEDSDEWWKTGEDALNANMGDKGEDDFPLTFPTGFSTWNTGTGWIRFQSFFKRGRGLQKWLNEIRTALRSSRGIMLSFPSIQDQPQDEPTFSDHTVIGRNPFIVFGYAVQTQAGAGAPIEDDSISFKPQGFTPKNGEDGNEVRLHIKASQTNALFKVMVTNDPSNMVEIDSENSIENAVIDYSSVRYIGNDTYFDVVISKGDNIGVISGTVRLTAELLDAESNTLYTGSFLSGKISVGFMDPTVPQFIPPRPKNSEDPNDSNYRFWKSIDECDALPVFDSCRKINLTNFVTDYLHETEMVDFIKSFEDELNSAFSGTCSSDPKSTHISILEKIDRLLDLQDPDKIDIGMIHHLASNLGYNMAVNILQSNDISDQSTDLKKYVRFFVSSLIEINRMKTTKDCIRGLMHSVGVLTNIYYQWTNEYDSYSENNWLESNENDVYDQNGIENVHVTENEFYLTPHFRLDLDISNIDLTTSDLMVGILTRVAQSVDAVKPVNTVSQDLSLSIPITARFSLKNVFITGWGDGINSEGEYDENWTSGLPVPLPPHPPLPPQPPITQLRVLLNDGVNVAPYPVSPENLTVDVTSSVGYTNELDWYETISCTENLFAVNNGITMSFVSLGTTATEFGDIPTPWMVVGDLNGSVDFGVTFADTRFIRVLNPSQTNIAPETQLTDKVFIAMTIDENRIGRIYTNVDVNGNPSKIIRMIYEEPIVRVSNLETFPLMFSSYLISRMYKPTIWDGVLSIADIQTWYDDFEKDFIVLGDSPVTLTLDDSGNETYTYTILENREYTLDGGDGLTSENVPPTYNAGVANFYSNANNERNFVYDSRTPTNTYVDISCDAVTNNTWPYMTMASVGISNGETHLMLSFTFDSGRMSLRYINDPEATTQSEEFWSSSYHLPSQTSSLSMRLVLDGNQAYIYHKAIGDTDWILYNHDFSIDVSTFFMDRTVDSNDSIHYGAFGLYSWAILTGNPEGYADVDISNVVYRTNNPNMSNEVTVAESDGSIIDYTFVDNLLTITPTTEGAVTIDLVRELVSKQITAIVVDTVNEPTITVPEPIFLMRNGLNEIAGGTTYSTETAPDSGYIDYNDYFVDLMGSLYQGTYHDSKILTDFVVGTTNKTTISFWAKSGVGNSLLVGLFDPSVSVNTYLFRLTVNTSTGVTVNVPTTATENNTVNEEDVFVAIVIDGATFSVYTDCLVDGTKTGVLRQAYTGTITGTDPLANTHLEVYSINGATVAKLTQWDDALTVEVMEEWYRQSIEDFSLVEDANVVLSSNTENGLQSFDYTILDEKKYFLYGGDALSTSGTVSSSMLTGQCDFSHTGAGVNGFVYDKNYLSSDYVSVEARIANTGIPEVNGRAYLGLFTLSSSILLSIDYATGDLSIIDHVSQTSVALTGLGGQFAGSLMFKMELDGNTATVSTKTLLATEWTEIDTADISSIMDRTAGSNATAHYIGWGVDTLTNALAFTTTFNVITVKRDNPNISTEINVENTSFDSIASSSFVDNKLRLLPVSNGNFNINLRRGRDLEIIDVTVVDSAPPPSNNTFVNDANTLLYYDFRLGTNGDTTVPDVAVGGGLRTLELNGSGVFDAVKGLLFGDTVTYGKTARLSEAMMGTDWTIQIVVELSQNPSAESAIISDIRDPAGWVFRTPTSRIPNFTIRDGSGWDSSGGVNAMVVGQQYKFTITHEDNLNSVKLYNGTTYKGGTTTNSPSYQPTLEHMFLGGWGFNLSNSASQSPTNLFKGYISEVAISNVVRAPVA